MCRFWDIHLHTVSSLKPARSHIAGSSPEDVHFAVPRRSPHLSGHSALGSMLWFSETDASVQSMCKNGSCGQAAATGCDALASV